MSAYFGLDIGSTSIKLLKLDGKKVTSLMVASNEAGKNVKEMNNAEKIRLTEIIKEMVKNSGVRGKQVVSSVPESLVYSKVMKFPVMSTPELATAIKWELEQSVPFPPNEVETSWSILNKPDKIKGDEKITVYVVAVPSPISETYVQLMETAELELVRLENEVPALIRAFTPLLGETNPSLLVDIGSSGTGLVLANKKNLFSNYYLPYGGIVMTKLISDAFTLPMIQAENYKRTYGMSKDQLEGKMYEVLKPVVSNLLGEIKKMIIAYKNENKDGEIDKVVLTGGGSYLSGLISFLSESLEGMEVVMGNPFSELNVEEKSKNLGPVYAISCGLAMEIS